MGGRVLVQTIVKAVVTLLAILRTRKKREEKKKEERKGIGRGESYRFINQSQRSRRS